MTATADPSIICDDSIGERALTIALGELGEREEGGNNRGPKVEAYLSSAGGKPGDAWCAAFVYYCYRAAAQAAGVVNPCPRTLAALRMWSLADPVTHTVMPARGRLAVLDHGKGLGHVSIVEEVLADGRIVDVSGNTNAQGSRAGDSVARHTWNPDNAPTERGARLVGFVDLGKAPTRPLVA